MAHTPGPWRFTPRTDYPNGHVEGIWGPDGEEIVITDSGYYPPTIDDARLICAAPDLLAVARLLVESAVNDSDACPLCGKDVARHDAECPVTFASAAVAKAEAR